jgi:hypothetical protein
MRARGVGEMISDVDVVVISNAATCGVMSSTLRSVPCSCSCSCMWDGMAVCTRSSSGINIGSCNEGSESEPLERRGGR